MFHIIRQHFFFRFFWFSNTQCKQKKRIYSVFKSNKEETAVGAKKNLCNRIDFYFDNNLVFIWIDLKRVLWIGTPCINIIILRKKTTTYAYNIYYLSSSKNFGFGFGKVFPTRNWDRLQIKNLSQFQKVKHCQLKFSLEYNTLHNIEWWEKTPVIHIVFLPPCNLCILQNYFFCPLSPCCVHF